MTASVLHAGKPAYSATLQSSVDAAAFSGIDAGAKIRSAINALGKTGGTVDARDLTGMQTISSTITIPDKVTVLLGQVSFKASVTPVFKLGSNSRLIGDGALGAPSEATLIQLSGSAGGSAIVASGPGIVIDSIHIIGDSISNRSIGFDLQGLVNGMIAHDRVDHFAEGIRVGWPNNRWKCDCYNLFVDDQVVGAAIGVDFDESTNKNTWIGGNVQPFGTGGVGFRLAGGANVLFSPDVENFRRGIALDFIGAGNVAYNLYAEAGGAVIQFESHTTHNFVWGVNAVSIATVEQYLTPDMISNIVFANDLGPGGSILWPYSWGARTIYLGQGSEPDYYSLSATPGNAAGGVNLDYTPNSQAQKVYGLTGHAPLHVGGLTADSLRLSGMMVSTGLRWPLPEPVVNGGSFYCPNCDPPMNPAADCTSSGTRTGSWVHGLNGRWMCVP